ncbi:MAG: chemotaxis protein [Gammaproteobacteria bacterium]|nr:MAG: chemotaxis protein [Gammaproteobacteria bacterium]
MSNVTILSDSSDELPTQVASLMVPVCEHFLLLPNVSVAEIIGCPPIETVKNKPKWFLGYVEWRNVHVPIVSFEVANGAEYTELVEPNRVAVLNGISGDSRLPFFCLATQGIPRLTRVHAEGIVESDAAEGDLEFMRVIVNGEDAVIPEIEKLEAMIIDHL